ncbi:MAG: hypothetical protein KDA41_10190, partial [Planctomycetales bacterium]|nr:hypothetical protein [Planctomycetales bacterium]
RYARSGRSDLAIELFQALAERHGEERVVDDALAWMVMHLASAEAAHHQAASGRASVQPASARVGAFETGVQGAAAVAPLGGFDQVVIPASAPADRGPPGAREAQRALALFATIERTRPRLAARPELQLAQAAAQRSAGQAAEATAVYRRLAAAPLSGPEGECARAELWISDPRSACPKPLVHCVRAGEKPFLDGKLDDALWQSARTMQLQSRYGEDEAWPAVALLARDDEFLYFAAVCTRVPGMQYEASAGPRPRDADLSGRDQLELLLDVNRDWSSYYRFQFDQRGFTAEACAGDAAWNPTYHVATAGDERQWTIEAAIPLSALTTAAPPRGACWGAAVKRIAPGVGKQSWGRAASFENAAAAGLLMFE